ncbi:MAG: SPOR domain-containing protein [Acidiferrobacterales bacterium]
MTTDRDKDYMTKALVFLAVFTALGSVTVNAAPIAIVEELQMPVWLERGQQRMPLQAGMPLKELDTLETGEAGRLVALFADGSLLEVGERTRISIERLSATMEAASITFQAFLDVAKGSFHYTAHDTVRTTYRDVGVRINSTIINVRQPADICGQSSVETELVCLIDGTITIEHPAVASFVMDKPRTVFIAPKSGTPTAVTTADPELFRAWTDATKLIAEHGITVPDGGWIVQLAATNDERAANILARRLWQAGYAASIKRVGSGNRTFYRLRVDQFDSELEARGFASRIKGQFGVTSPWVTHATVESRPHQSQ